MFKPLVKSEHSVDVQDRMILLIEDLSNLCVHEREGLLIQNPGIELREERNIPRITTQT